jgi:hypothetical protein
MISFNSSMLFRMIVAILPSRQFISYKQPNKKFTFNPTS